MELFLVIGLSENKTLKISVYNKINLDTASKNPKKSIQNRHDRLNRFIDDGMCGLFPDIFKSWSGLMKSALPLRDTSGTLCNQK